MPRPQGRPQLRFRAAATLADRYDESVVHGLPASAMVISNSERKDAHCGRRWWFSRSVGLQSLPGKALRFGAAYDEAMGRILEFYRDNDGALYTQGGLHRCPACAGDGWLYVDGQQQDCASCGGTGLGAFALVARQLALTPEVYEEDGGLDAELERLQRALEGWLQTYDASMASEYRVLAVQPTFAVPITSPTTGQVYRSKVPVVPTDDGWRLATGHDLPDTVQLVLLPWYQLVKLDAVVQERRSGTLRTWEVKTSGTPEGFSADLLLDTQLPGYVRALWYVTQALGLYDGAQPGGWLWDVTSSQPHRDPRRLKDGSWSTAKNQRVPSWRWRQALADEPLNEALASREADRLEQLLQGADAEYDRAAQAAKEAGSGKAGAPFRAARAAAKEAAKAAKVQAQGMRNRADALAMVQLALETVDPALYVRRWGKFTPERLREYELELYADAVRISSWLRAMPGTASQPWQHDERVALNWPRVPLCRLPGGHCPYTGPCLEDSAEARSSFDTRQPLRWLHSAALAVHHTPPEKDDTP